MKRIAILVCVVAVTCAAIGWSAYRASTPPADSLSKFVPAGPLLYLEAKDFSALLKDWNSSSEKKTWVQSDNYQVFSRSRLFLRLKGAGDQFAAAAGLPPDMDFLSQIAGERSALAIYDIGKLQFLYITYLPSARATDTKLWQTRAKFEPRNAGGVDFYFRRDPESEREVAFAVFGDYLVLATREDLIAGALQLISGKQDRTVETEQWWAHATTAAGKPGDLRMVLDLQNLVPNGYFRTYWVQQNITDLSQYSAAVSDLFRSSRLYREERVLIRKKDPERESNAEASAAASELTRLIPEDAGVYVVAANPTAASSLTLLKSKLLAPHVGPSPASQIAPQVVLTSGEQGSASDLETRIDQAPSSGPESQAASALKELLDQTPLLASLQVQSTERDPVGVFVRIHSAVVLVSSFDWDDGKVQTALSEFVRPSFTASQLGVGWVQKSGYQELDGLWPMAVSTRGKYFLVSDDASMMKSLLANFVRKSDFPAIQLFAGFRHDRERGNFERFTKLVDRATVATAGGNDAEREPQFFSGNIRSVSSTLAGVSAERIEVRAEGGKVRQTVTYEWSQ